MRRALSQPLPPAWRMSRAISSNAVRAALLDLRQAFVGAVAALVGQQHADDAAHDDQAEHHGDHQLDERHALLELRVHSCTCVVMLSESADTARAARIVPLNYDGAEPPSQFDAPVAPSPSELIEVVAPARQHGLRERACPVGDRVGRADVEGVVFGGDTIGAHGIDDRVRFRPPRRRARARSDCCAACASAGPRGPSRPIDRTSTATRISTRPDARLRRALTCAPPVHSASPRAFHVSRSGCRRPA